ncbi:MAG: hypothetical protein K9N49_06285 [Candidatus Marinimicrobia bacterium]|nr:hypothetical protein [Candidatus Neomarinimicrobiota bacterium]
MDWRLRKQDGTEYGPAPLEQFCCWARQNRIAPEDELQADGGAWQPATEIRALQLDWFVPSAEPPGESGPYHLATLAELILAGDLPLMTPVRRYDQEAPCPAARAISEAAQSLWAAAPGADETEAEPWQKLYEREVSRNQIMVRDQAEALAASRAREKESRTELADVRRQLNQLQRDYDHLQDLMQGDPSRATLLEWAGLIESHRALLDQYEELTSRSEAQTSAEQTAHDAVHAELAQMQALLDAQEQRAGVDRELAEAAISKQRAAEKQLAHLQRAYRDLNERYIRDKQGRLPSVQSAREPPPDEPENTTF